VKVNVMSGSIAVRVGPGRDVVVATTAVERGRDDRARNTRDRSGADPADGLHRLTPPGGVDIEEENNTVSISAPVLAGPMNVTIQVPAATSLVLRAVTGGEVTVDGVSGSIEVLNVNGSIRLTDVGGPVVAHATNGTVAVTLRQLAAGKPMSFTSFNGNVDVTLPGPSRANLKMRSGRGDVYTDFDVQLTPAPAGARAGDQRHDDSRSSGQDNRAAGDSKDKPKYRLEMERSIYGTINGGGPDFELRTFNGNVYLRKAK
jgi:hypothetical protein